MIVACIGGLLLMLLTLRLLCMSKWCRAQVPRRERPMTEVAVGFQQGQVSVVSHTMNKV